jgi:twitching motility protein PilT
MAAIDSLLMLMDAQQASGLVLRARETPVLVGGKGRGLTMPPLDRQTIETFAEEVLSPDEMTQLRATGSCAASYRSERHGSFAIEAQASADSMALKLRRGGAVLARPAAPQAAASAPIAQATSLGGGATAAAPPSWLTPIQESTTTALASEPPSPAPPLPVAMSSSSERAPDSEDPARAALAARLAGVIARATGDDVSDLILSAGQPLWIRSADGFRAASGTAIGALEIRAFADTLLDPPHLQTLERTGSVDVAWQAPEVDDEGARRFRVNVFTQTNGLAVALRPVNRRAPSFAELNLPDSLGNLAMASGGLVLVVGPTGSGKSSTLAAMVETVNRTRDRHIITLEDPIEHVYQTRRCLIHQREVGTHVDSFASGLRAALRECPDIILVGEMRDRETVAMALTAAETGHLVLSTLHSGSAPMAIDRIVDIFPEHQQGQIRQELAGCLRAVLTQQLLPGVRPGTRFPAIELLTVNYAVGALIREGKTHQLATQIQTGRDDGMIAFEASLVELVRTGRIAKETALGAAHDPTELQRRLRA